jgi:hypothetical protein
MNDVTGVADVLPLYLLIINDVTDVATFQSSYMCHQLSILPDMPET